MTPEQKRRALILMQEQAQAADQSGPQVIATTDDGGRIMVMPDGSRSFASPGYSTSDPEIIDRIMQGATPKQEVQRSFDEQRIAENPIAARVQEFNQGVPFVGEWLDEGVEMVSPQAAQNMRATSDAMERQRPGESLALNVAGGVAGSVPLAMGARADKAADFVTRGGNMVMRGLRAATVAAPVAAAEGAASFAGRADEGERGRAAAVGALVGGGLGAFLGPVATMLGEGAASLAKRVKRLDVRAIADEFNLSPAAARTVKEALANDDLDAAAARLSQLGDDAMLADSGPATGQLLNASSATGGKALRVTRDAVSRRSDEIGARLPGRLDAILGKPQGIRASAREISRGTAAARDAAYTRAYSQPIDYSGPGRRIEEVLQRVPPRTLRTAIDEANEAMREAGTRNRQIMAEIADDGSVRFREMPNVEQLDQIKRALDTIGREAVDQFGRPTSQGSRARRLARDLRDATADAVPAYRSALKVGGDKIQRDEALDLGRKLLFRNTSVEDVSDFMRSGVSSEAREAVRQGVRESIETTLSNVRRTITDPDVDAREAMQLVKEVSSRANKAKLRAVLGESKADALLNELDRAATALTLRAAVSRNSDTAIRTAIQGQVRDEATPGLPRRTLGNLGSPLDAGKEITQTIAGIDPRSMSAAEKAIFDEIATALTSIRGQDAQRALAAVRGALNGQPIKDAEAALIGRLVGGSAAAGGYQSAKQPLAR